MLFEDRETLRRGDFVCMQARFGDLDGGPNSFINSIKSTVSLGRAVPALHTRLLGLFAAMLRILHFEASQQWTLSPDRQHSCRGSEELAIRKTARFQATPNYSDLSQSSNRLRRPPELLRAAPSQGRPRTPSYSEPIPASPSTPSSVLRCKLRKRCPKQRAEFRIPD